MDENQIIVTFSLNENYDNFHLSNSSRNCNLKIWVILQHSKNKHINMHKMYHMMVIITLNHEICMVILNKERRCGQNASKIQFLKRVSGANKIYIHPNGC